MTYKDQSSPRPSWVAEAFAQLTDGAFEGAIERFSQGLAAEPKQAAAYQGRALACVQLKRWSEAIADFATAKRLNPDDLENWLGLGMSLAMDHQIYEAIDVFEKLLAAHPDYARGHLQLGVLYLQLCATAKGRQHLERALACRPSLAERRLIERVFKEQEALDRKRYYRPDFEALRARRHSRKAVGINGLAG